MPNATVLMLDGADHGFAVLKSSGRSREDVWNEVAASLLAWLQSEVTGDNARDVSTRSQLLPPDKKYPRRLSAT